MAWSLVWEQADSLASEGNLVKTFPKASLQVLGATLAFFALWASLPPFVWVWKQVTESNSFYFE